MTLAELFALRRRGKRPDGIVVLSLCGPLKNLPGDAMLIEVGRDPDVRGCAELDVIIAHEGTSWNCELAVQLSDLLVRVNARNLDIWIVPEKRAVSVIAAHHKTFLETPPPWL